MKNNFLSINILRCNYFSIQIDTRKLGLLAQNLIWSIWHHNFKSWTALLCNFCNVYHNGSYNWLPRSISSPCSFIGEVISQASITRTVLVIAYVNSCSMLLSALLPRCNSTLQTMPLLSQICIYYLIDRSIVPYWTVLQ